MAMNDLAVREQLREALGTVRPLVTLSREGLVAHRARVGRRPAGRLRDGDGGRPRRAPSSCASRAGARSPRSRP